MTKKLYQKQLQVLLSYIFFIEKTSKVEKECLFDHLTQVYRWISDGMYGFTWFRSRKRFM